MYGADWGRGEGRLKQQTWRWNGDHMEIRWRNDDSTHQMDPGSNNSYIKGRTWATVQIASQGSFCTKKWSCANLFFICIHFVVVSFEILICIL